MSFSAPLAERLRARHLSDLLGQEHLLAKGKPLAQMIAKGRLQSMILWGPPGTGKTSLARLLAEASGAHWRAISAVHDGVKDIKRMIDEAKADQLLGQRSVLFVDEIHRFNKAQQDALLPAVESGLLTLIGATTENPSFALNNALLSRARVYVLKSLSTHELCQLLERGLQQLAQEQQWQQLCLAEAAQPWLLAYADGDGRKLLNLLEQLADFAQVNADQPEIMFISTDAVKVALSGGQVRRFDREGEAFYDQISALHKAVRGSSVDAALYWFARMLDGGCDPLYLARRLVRMASEEIANADPRALTVALDALNAYQLLGSPEGELALAQAVTYLATAPKSNAVYTAYKSVRKLVATMTSHEVPLHLRNAPTQLLVSLDYGKGYRYAHDEPHAYAAGESYFPEALAAQPPVFYQPVPRGYEQTICQRLDFWQTLDQQTKGNKIVMMSFSALAAVAIGGAAGSVVRYWLAHQMNLLMGVGGFAWGTFTVNVLGGFAIGFVLIALQEWLHADSVWRLLLVVGFLGGFTTFSSFSWDTYTLWMNAKHGLAVLNVLANVAFSLVGTVLGVWVARVWLVD